MLIIDPGAALGLSLARTVRRYGCDATISTSVAHALATLAQNSVQLLIVHDTSRISASQLAMLRQHGRPGTTLPCVVLGARGSSLAEGDARLVQTPVETHDVMAAIKSALGLSPERRRPPTHSQIRRISSLAIPVARGEFSISDEPSSPQRSADAAGPDARHAYSVQSRARKTLRLMPAMTSSQR